MTNKTMRFESISFSTSGVDETTGVIKDVCVCQLGEAKGHDVFIDETFLSQVVTSANEKTKGLKVRFGHPEAFTSSLGKFIGRAKNFRVDGNTARCDLTLSQSAKKSPNGDLFSYVADMCKSNPDMIGMSLCFSASGVDEVAGLPYVRCGEVTGIDIVDDPAACPNGMFESKQETTTTSLEADDMPSETKTEIINLGKAVDDLKIIITEKDAKITELSAKIDADKIAFEAEKAEMVKSAETAAVKLGEDVKASETLLASCRAEFEVFKAEKTALETKLAAYKGAEPVTFSSADKEESARDAKKAKYEADKAKYTNHLGANLAKFAASVQIRK